MDTGRTKLYNQNALVDQVGGQNIRVEENGVPAGINKIEDARRGAWPIQYRERGKLTGAADKKMPCLDCGMKMMGGYMTAHFRRIHGT